jgi:hypothetical protein
VLIFFVVVGGRTVRIRTIHTARERGHEFQGCFEGFSCCSEAVQIRSYNKLWAHFPRCCFLGGSYSATNFARFPRQNLWGQNLGVVSGFLLLEIVISLLIYFLEANKISLFGFPHIRVFPGWLPKFLSITWMCDCCSLCLFHCKSAWQCVFFIIIFSECGFIHFRVHS